MKKTIIVLVVVIAVLGLLVLAYSYLKAAESRNFGKGVNGVLTNSIQLPDVKETSNFASMIEPWQLAQKDYTAVNEVISNSTVTASQKGLVEEIRNFYTVSLKDGESELETLALIQNFKKDAVIADSASSSEAEKAVSDTMTRIKKDMDDAQSYAKISPEFQQDADKVGEAAQEYYNDLDRTLQDVKAGKSPNISQDKLFGAVDILVTKIVKEASTK